MPKSLSAHQRRLILPTLLYARDRNGVPGLRLALENKKKSTVFAFADIVKQYKGDLSNAARAHLLKMIHGAHGSNEWYTAFIWTNNSYYEELIKDQEFYRRFKEMKAVLKVK